MINYKYVTNLLKIIPRFSKLENLTITSPKFLNVNPVPLKIIFTELLLLETLWTIIAIN